MKNGSITSKSSVIQSKSSVKVVSFDLWQTLIRGSRTGKNRATFLHEITKTDLNIEEFTKLLKLTDDEVDKESELTGVSYGPEYRLDKFYDKLGLKHMTSAQKRQFYKNRTESLFKNPPILIDPETLDILDELTKLYELAIISNTGFINGLEMRVVLEKIGILKYFTYKLFSDELGICKPHADIFNLLSKQAGIKHKHIAHVGDNLVADVKGAQNVGMIAIHRPKDTSLRTVLNQLLNDVEE